MWDYGWSVAETLDAKGVVRGRDLQVMVGAGDGHNEAAWKRRLPDLLRFLLPVTDGPNLLLLAESGAPKTELDFLGGVITVQIPSLRGWRYELRGKANLNDPTWDLIAWQSRADPWGTLTFQPALPPDAVLQFFRIHVVP
jgi:hypothetical protein